MGPGGAVAVRREGPEVLCLSLGLHPREPARVCKGPAAIEALGIGTWADPCLAPRRPCVGPGPSATLRGLLGAMLLFTCSFIPSPLDALTLSFIHSLVNPFAHPFSHPFFHASPVGGLGAGAAYGLTISRPSPRADAAGGPGEQPPAEARWFRGSGAEVESVVTALD